jgi:RHS repeat-associated protein
MAGAPSAKTTQVSLSTGTVTYLVADSLGSVRGTVSGTGALTGTTSYDAWGNPQTSGGLTSITPFGFAGGYTDPDGLLYLINRYYDPVIGQFLSVDADVSQTQQPYAYTSGDPVSSSDPDGDACGTCLGPVNPGGSGGGSSEPNSVSDGGIQMGMSLTGFEKNSGHASAVMGAYMLIALQLVDEQGYSPTYVMFNLVVEAEVPAGTKSGKRTNGVLNDGYADLDFDNRNGIQEIWEVKAASYGAEAGQEAAGYVRAYNKAGIPAVLGFALYSVFPMALENREGYESGIVWVNEPMGRGGPGGILYTVEKFGVPRYPNFPTVKEVAKEVAWVLGAVLVGGILYILAGIVVVGGILVLAPVGG